MDELRDEPPVRHLVANVYRWGLEDQDAFLVHCLRRAAQELRRSGDLEQLWFDRFDARGPHVMVLATVPADRAESVRRGLDETFVSFLAENPSRTELSVADLEMRHRGCQGKQLCSLDGLDGLAAADTVAWSIQPSDAYPFRLFGGLSELWPRCDQLTAWVLEGLAAGASRTAAGIAFLASLEEALATAPRRSADYWEHHARSLIGRLETNPDPAAMVARLTTAIGSNNGRRLAAAWRPAGPDFLPQLVARIGARDSAEPTPEKLLRELVHITLKQLGIVIRLQRPLILFGWRRALERQVS